MLEKQKAPKLILSKNGKPLELNHKFEDITIIDNETVLLIADDDRVTSAKERNAQAGFQRKPNQAAYVLIKLLKKEE